MQKGLLLFGYRGGSTMLQHLLQSGEKPVVPSGYKLAKTCCWIPTVPPHTSLFYSLNDALQLGSLDIPFDQCIWWIHVAHQVNKIRDSVKHFERDTRVMTLTRDGRNQIASLKQMKKKLSQVEYSKWFQKACEGFRDRVRLTQELQGKFKYTRIYKMEDLFAETRKVITSIYDFWGLIPNYSFIDTVIQKMPTKTNPQLKHSSFGSVKDLNQRWKTLTKDELKMFYQIAGKEQAYLGYPE